MVRRALLEREKELTRLSDELAEQRQTLPRVRIDEPYTFRDRPGTKTLAELFAGRSQLIVYHFMHGPNTPAGCSGCTFAADRSTARSPTSTRMTSPSSWPRARRWRRSARTNGAWAGACRGSRRVARTSTATSPPGPKRTAATARAGTSGRPAARSLPEQRLRRRAPFSPRAGRPSPRSVTRR